MRDDALHRGDGEVLLKQPLRDVVARHGKDGRTPARQRWRAAPARDPRRGRGAGAARAAPRPGPAPAPIRPYDHHAEQEEPVLVGGRRRPAHQGGFADPDQAAAERTGDRRGRNPTQICQHRAHVVGCCPFTIAAPPAPYRPRGPFRADAIAPPSLSRARCSLRSFSLRARTTPRIATGPPRPAAAMRTARSPCRRCRRPPVRSNQTRSCLSRPTSQRRLSDVLEEL